MARDVELLEGVETEEPGAVHRVADLFVLFQHDDRMPVRRQATCGDQACGAGTDHHDIDHLARGVA